MVSKRAHGANEYANYHCRCDVCSSAWSAYVKAGVKRRKRRGVFPLGHGKPGTYSDYGCRCPQCRDGWNAYRRGEISRKGEAL